MSEDLSGRFRSDPFGGGPTADQRADTALRAAWLAVEGLPQMTRDLWVAVALRSAAEVYQEVSWVSWAEGWHSGADRSVAAAQLATKLPRDDYEDALDSLAQGYEPRAMYIRIRDSARAALLAVDAARRGSLERAASAVALALATWRLSKGEGPFPLERIVSRSRR